MSAEEIVFDAEGRMEKAIQVLRQSLSGVRTGRANPALVDSLRVEVYGAAAPIRQLATVGSPDPTQIVIRPYDPGTLKDIERRSSPATSASTRRTTASSFGSTFPRCRWNSASGWSAASAN